MRIIPVIDLKGGVVVRGVAGRRDQYRPVAGHIARSAEPADVATALVEKLGLEEVYVADLDAIAGQPPAREIYQAIAGCGLRLWVDAGLANCRRARELAEFRAGGMPLAGIVAALETAPGPSFLDELVAAVGGDRLVFSLDLKDGRPLTEAPPWQGMTAEEIAAEAIRSGLTRLILLDLARVGIGAGAGTEALCRRLRDRSGQLEIIAGGGVRGRGDLRSLAEAGCNAALVASALHDGRITPDDIRLW